MVSVHSLMEKRRCLEVHWIPHLSSSYLGSVNVNFFLQNFINSWQCPLNNVINLCWEYSRVRHLGPWPCISIQMHWTFLCERGFRLAFIHRCITMALTGLLTWRLASKMAGRLYKCRWCHWHWHITWEHILPLMELFRKFFRKMVRKLTMLLWLFGWLGWWEEWTSGLFFDAGLWKA